MVKILLIGDSCQDVFVYCNAKRLAPDLPVPVLEQLKEVRNPGMALNVLQNIESLGGEVEIVTNSNWGSIFKTRYIHLETNHTFFRVDSGLKSETLKFYPDMSNYDAVVISDYDKGFLTQSDINEICKRHKRVFLDTKKILGPWCLDAFIVKINDSEYNKSRDFIEKNLKEKVVHTLGSQGAEFLGISYSAETSEIRDLTGAGDTFLAGLVLRFCETLDMSESISFANKCASQVVKVRGVGTASRE